MLSAALTSGAFGQAPAAVERAAARSPLVQSSIVFLTAQARLITDRQLRLQTLDAITNPATCVQHRRNLDADAQRGIVTELTRDTLLAAMPLDAALAGVFPPLRDDQAACPKLRQSFRSSAGSSMGHHDYPGGLPVHEAYNLRGGLALAGINTTMYLRPGGEAGPMLDVDVIRAAILWHDWAKAIVLGWQDDGTLTPEIQIAGTGAHHIIGVAEAMARQLSIAEVLAQVSSHASPGLRANAEIVRWLRAAAIIARCDPVASGYLVRTPAGQWQLPTLFAGHGDSLADGNPVAFSAFPEAAIVNVSDENLFSIAASAQVEPLLAILAPLWHYAPADAATYRNNFRNPVLSHDGADRLALLFARGGRGAVRRELDRLRGLGVFQAAH
ncbi:MAG TPA: hypothetical protein VGM77_09615 [Gemmatimonadales bacterium]|jgi:hypothetical protein